MSEIKKMDYEEFRRQIPEFAKKTEEFHKGEMTLKEYKGFSGKFGSYAQRGGKRHMLRLRMNGGRLTKEKMRFIIDAAKKHNCDLLHFTTCQTVQMHNLEPEAVSDIMDKALDAGIVCYGGGGDYPRNVMCSPLAGVDPEEYFDVMPYALASSEFLLQFIDAEKMPRKLKVGFSGSAANAPHATFRDLGFMANENGTFDVYIAGGLGSNPRLGIKVAEQIPVSDILYYIEAMIRLFRKYGNYANRAKARTRYLQETFENEEALRQAFSEELNGVKADEQITLESVEPILYDKQGDGILDEESFRIKEQKQPGLYTVSWHPLGGSIIYDDLEALYDVIRDMEQVEVRLAPDETAYIINLTAEEAKKVLDVTKDNAASNPFESSIGCVGAAICQVGLRDSQSLLAKCINTVKEEGLSAYLPQIHISGCPSSCGTHQVGSIGFRGAVKLIDKKPVPAFVLYAGGDEAQHHEKLGREVGTITEEQIPAFLCALANAVKQSGTTYEEWAQANPDGLDEIAAEYIA